MPAAYHADKQNAVYYHGIEVLKLGVYVGMDGGATKTAISIVDECGAEIGRGEVGGINVNSAEAGIVRASIHKAVEFARRYAIDGMCVGAAGLTTPGACERLEALVREAGYAGQLDIIGDQDAALIGAMGQAEGLVLIAGTGSVCCGKLGERRARSGGWGYRIDDVGSGYAIGCGILTAVVRAHDGRIPATCLTQSVYERLGIADISEMIGWTYAPGTTHRDIAALSQLITPACERGDQAALGIIARSAAELFELVRAGSVQLWPGDAPPTIELALLGSVLVKQPHLRAAVIGLLPRLPHIRLIEPRGDAALGAARFALAAVRDRAARQPQ